MNLIWITNITDYPHNPEDNSLAHILEIYGVQVMPGESVQIDTDLINDQIRALVEHKSIIIGDWPSYYRDFRVPPQKTQAELLKEANQPIPPEPEEPELVGAIKKKKKDN